MNRDRNRSNRRALALLFAAAWIGPAAAEDVVGVLVSPPSDGGYPIAFAEVSVCPEETPRVCVEAVTGSDGSFSMTGLPPGRYNLTARYERGSLSDVLDVHAGEPNEVRLVPPD